MPVSRWYRPVNEWFHDLNQWSYSESAFLWVLCLSLSYSQWDLSISLCLSVLICTAVLTLCSRSKSVVNATVPELKLIVTMEFWFWWFFLEFELSCWDTRKKIIGLCVLIGLYLPGQKFHSMLVVKRLIMKLSGDTVPDVYPLSTVRLEKGIGLRLNLLWVKPHDGEGRIPGYWEESRVGTGIALTTAEIKWQKSQGSRQCWSTETNIWKNRTAVISKLCTYSDSRRGQL